MPLQLPAWELAGDLDLEAKVLIGLRPGVQRVSVLLSGASVAPALGGRPWRSGGARRPCPGTTRAGFAEALWPDSTGVLGQGAQSYLLSGV